MIAELLHAYRKRRLVLFVGAGISKNLGLPTWMELISHMAQELGFDADVFLSFGSHYTLAEYYKLQKNGKIYELCSWMDREWHKESIDIGSSRIHELIAKSGVDLIYTTNYDRWIELAFEHWGVPCTKVASVEDLTKDPQEGTQIVKLHGDFDAGPESIVLDETSYFERLQFESPLDIKLRSDVLGKSVLFIGYSLADINIRLLFYKLSKLWKTAHAPSQPPSFFFSSKPNSIQERTLAQWNIQMICPEIDDPKQALIDLLDQLRLARSW